MNHVFCAETRSESYRHPLLSVLIPVQSSQVDPQKLERTGTPN